MGVLRSSSLVMRSLRKIPLWWWCFSVLCSLPSFFLFLWFSFFFLFCVGHLLINVQCAWLFTCCGFGSNFFDVLSRECMLEELQETWCVPTWWLLWTQVIGISVFCFLEPSPVWNFTHRTRYVENQSVFVQQTKCKSERWSSKVHALYVLMTNLLETKGRAGWCCDIPCLDHWLAAFRF